MSLYLLRDVYRVSLSEYLCKTSTGLDVISLKSCTINSNTSIQLALCETSIKDCSKLVNGFCQDIKAYITHFNNEIENGNL